MLEVCLINPPRLILKYSTVIRPSPPLGLAYIAGTLKAAGCKLSVLDCMAEAPEQLTIFDGDIVLHGLSYRETAERIPPDVDIIGIGCMFSNNWMSNRELIDYLGESFPNALIVAGGEHVTAAPEFSMRQAAQLDVVVLGEGEETMREIADAVRNGQPLADVSGIVYRNKETRAPCRTAPRSRIKAISEIPWPAWELFPLAAYQEHDFSYGVTNEKSLPVMATRGCPYSCTFCSSPQMWGTKYQMREPEDVLSEIRFLNDTYGITNFDFFDLTAIITKKWIVAFTRLLIDSDLAITWQIPAGTRMEAIDEEVSQLLYRSGCVNITYAPESGSLDVLRDIRKKVKLPMMLKSIRTSRKAGMNIKLNMIIGFPEERPQHVWQTIGFLIKASWAGAHDAYPFIFSPYPGSKLFKDLEANGEIDLNDDTYFRRIIQTNTFTQVYSYNHHMGKRTMVFYLIAEFVAFYLSNYLFRPWRPFRSVWNVLTNKAQSRGEITLREMIKTKKKTVTLLRDPKLYELELVRDRWPGVCDL